MPNLADSFMRNKFVKALESCEREVRKGSRTHFTDWEKNFIEGMRVNFEGRADAEDFGVTPWSPNAKQWNQLMELGRKADA